MKRRSFLTSGGAFAALGWSSLGADYRLAGGVFVPQTAAQLLEEQAGDPSLSTENLSIDESTRQKILEVLSRVSRGPKVPRPKLALETLRVAKTHIGNSRTLPATRVKQYLSLYGLPFQMEGKYVPYCASGVGFAACQAYRMLTKQPADIDSSNISIIFRDSLTDVKRDFTFTHPACAEMVKAAQSTGLWRSKTQGSKRVTPKPGWLVFFNWKGGNHAQHVGIVDRPEAKVVRTVEFNTSNSDFSNGGAVLARQRDYKFVIGYIDTYSEPKTR